MPLLPNPRPLSHQQHFAGPDAPLTAAIWESELLSFLLLHNFPLACRYLPSERLDFHVPQRADAHFKPCLADQVRG